MRSLNEIISDIRYGCYAGITTRSQCKNGCEHSARGGGACLACLQTELGEVCGDRVLAMNFCHHTREAGRALGKMEDVMEENESEATNGK